MFSTDEQKKLVREPALLRGAAQRMLSGIYLDENNIPGGFYKQSFSKLIHYMTILNEMYDQSGYQSGVKSTSDDPDDIIRFMDENEVDIEKKVSEFENVIPETLVKIANEYDEKRKQIVNQLI